MEPGLRRFDVRDYLRIVTKRKWFIILVALAATIIGGLYAVSYPKTYRAATTVLVRRQAKPTVWIGDRASPATEPIDLALETQANIARSTDCADRAAKALAARTTGDRIQTSANEITASVSAVPREPEQIRIEAVHRLSNYAVDFANEVAEAFVAMNSNLRQRDARIAKEFLVEALRRAKVTLDEAQAQAAAYQESIGIIVPKAEGELHVTQLYAYRDTVRKTDAELASSEAQLASVRRQLRGVEPFTKSRIDSPNPAREVLLRQIEAEQISLAQLRARYTGSWPAVREAERRVAELQAELAREPETVPRTEVEPDLRLRQLQEAEINAARQVAALRAQLATMRRTANSLALASRRMPSKLDRLQRLLDRAELGKTAYQNILAQLETARLNEAMKQADAYIIDHAANPDEISPKLGRMLAFAFLLGIVCGIVLAMVLEALDDTFHTPDDITAYTDVTFLGIVPLLEEPGPGLVAASAPKSPPAEAYRTLRSNIRFAQLDSPARTFLVTSAGAGEGKTLTTANLAAVFAQAGQEVLLVDTDLRRPSLHRLLNLSAEHGLTNVLMGEATLEEVTQDTEIPGLRVVTTGPLPPNPAELIESRHMTAVIERAREMADVVFFDSPPAIILTDAVILSSKVERTLLVAEAGQVSRDAFNEMCRMIRNARGEILGVVLNKLRLSASDYYYYYYYYDYSHSAPRRDSGPSGAATPGGNQGLVRPEAPTVLDTLFGEEPPTSGPPRQGAAVTPTPDDAMLLPGEEPRPAAGATPARPTDDGRPAAMPPGTRRWRFNGRSFRAETPNGDGTARRGNDTPTGPAEGGPGPEDGAQTPPAANGSSANADRSILEDLFGESEDEK